MKLLKIFSILLLLSLFSCKSADYYKYKTFDFPQKIDTSDRQIQRQKKDVFQIDDVLVDNRFDAARMNGFSKINDTVYQIEISAENEPVNPSPWYAFQIYSTQDKDIFLRINYVHAKHRYRPKISRDRIQWDTIPQALLTLPEDKSYIVFPLHLNTEKIYVAAQPVINTSDVKNWIQKLRENPLVTDVKSIGKSVENREIPFLKIGNNTTGKKEIIVLLSRQHPPEVTGFQALQYFIDELLQDNRLTHAFYNKYEVWIFPLLNPDGVDLGHWRHNAHGVDLNRDWAYYRQPEIKAVTQFIVNEAKKSRQKVVLGIDFHSTFKDVYYVYNNQIHSVIPDFNASWTYAIDRLTPVETYYSPGAMNLSVSKNWFYRQFKAEGITYEVGDDTPVELVKRKAETAAILMMTALLK